MLQERWFIQREGLTIDAVQIVVQKEAEGGAVRVVDLDLKLRSWG